MSRTKIDKNYEILLRESEIKRIIKALDETKKDPELSADLKMVLKGIL